MIGACIDSWLDRLVIATVTFPNPAAIPDTPGDFNKMIVAAQRGDDTLLPGTPGVVPNPRRETVTVHTAAFTILGECDFDGVPYSDERDGLTTNLAILEGIQIVGGDGTQAIGVLGADGVSRTALAHVSLEVGDMPEGFGGIQTVVLSLSFPTGKVV